MKETGGRRLIE